MKLKQQIKMEEEQLRERQIREFYISTYIKCIEMGKAVEDALEFAKGGVVGFDDYFN